MNQFTVRGIPASVEKAINDEAEQKGVSHNKAIIHLLEKAAGAHNKGKASSSLYHDLDHLCGIWDEKEELAFRKSLESQRKIERDLWK